MIRKILLIIAVFLTLLIVLVARYWYNTLPKLAQYQTRPALVGVAGIQLPIYVKPGPPEYYIWLSGPEEITAFGEAAFANTAMASEEWRSSQGGASWYMRGEPIYAFGADGNLLHEIWFYDDKVWGASGPASWLWNIHGDSSCIRLRGEPCYFPVADRWRNHLAAISADHAHLQIIEISVRAGTQMDDIRKAANELGLRDEAVYWLSSNDSLSKEPRRVGLLVEQVPDSTKLATLTEAVNKAQDTK